MAPVLHGHWIIAGGHHHAISSGQYHRVMPILPLLTHALAFLGLS